MMGEGWGGKEDGFNLIDGFFFFYVLGVLIMTASFAISYVQEMTK